MACRFAPYCSYDVCIAPMMYVDDFQFAPMVFGAENKPTAVVATGAEKPGAARAAIAQYGHSSQVSLNQTHQIRCLPYLLCCGSLSSLDLFGAGMAPTVSLSSRSRLSRSNFPKSLRSTAQRAELPWSNLVIARLLSLCAAMIMTAHTGTATRVPPLRLRLPSTRSL
jgi:hypothetical protein